MVISFVAVVECYEHRAFILALLNGIRLGEKALLALQCYYV